MSKEIINQLNDAKQSMEKADTFIAQYFPFIKAQASKVAKRSISEQDDEFSIAMIAFHEGIKSYEEKKGNFISFASLLIRNRIIDFYRKNAKHQMHVSMDSPDEQGILLSEKIKDEKNDYLKLENKEKAKMEIEELKETMSNYQISFTDIAENAPKQQKTLIVCKKVVEYAIDHTDILEDIARTGKLPVTLLAKKNHVSKKTLERHRKYILALMMIQTNGFEMIREHIKGLFSIETEQKQ